MDKTYVAIVLFPIIALLMIFMTEYTLHTIYFNKMTSVSEFAVKTAENEGSLSPAVIEKIEYRMKQEGLSKEKFELVYQDVSKINYNKSFEINIIGSFTYHALNMFGTGVGNIDVMLEAPNIGYSNVWYR